MAPQWAIEVVEDCNASTASVLDTTVTIGEEVTIALGNFDNGECSYELELLTACMDTTSGQEDGLCSSYTDNCSTCGDHDTENFVCQDMCCSCNGGDSVPTETTELI